MRKKKTSITEVAKALGIAPSTVSRALNGLPGVSEEMRAKIREYAQGIGYAPNSASKSAGEGKLDIIAITLGDIRNPFYADLVFAVQKELAAHGYLLVVLNHNYSGAEELRYIHMAERLNVAGVIQVTAASEEMSASLKELSIPVVMVNRMLTSFETDVVLLDNYEAGYIATRHLIELGHSRIGFLLGQMASGASGERYKGYLKAMENYNLEIQECDVLQGDLTMETAYAKAKELIANVRELPTAMIVSNDLAAHGFISCCMDEGLRIPQMMSVVSFDNIRFTSAGCVPLTTIDAHVADMGRIAADLMLKRIRHPNMDTERVVLSPTLVKRKSTIPYRQTIKRQPTAEGPEK